MFYGHGIAAPLLKQFTNLASWVNGNVVKEERGSVPHLSWCHVKSVLRGKSTPQYIFHMKLLLPNTNFIWGVHITFHYELYTGGGAIFHGSTYFI